VQLFLSGNQIRRLPLELFDVLKMTVLILRASSRTAITIINNSMFNANLGANVLTYLPPEIAHLKNLRELNVSSNRLSYLPSEMVAMNLTQLHIYPNPFLPAPAENPTCSFTRSSTRTTISSDSLDTRQRRHVSPTIHTLPRMIPLLELCFRALFSSSHRNLDEECILESHYELPLYEYPFYPDMSPPPAGKKRIYRVIPQHIGDVLNVCIPGSIDVDDTHVSHVSSDNQPQELASSTQSEDSEVTGIGTCPSPRHFLQVDGTGREGKGWVFVKHAEERLTWEERIAGVAVGGTVPVKWRGCQWGCLDFLDPNETEGNGEEEGEEGEGEGEGELSEDEDVEMEIVQLVQFNSDGFDMEGFEE